MTVFLSTEMPPGESEELFDDRAFLIKGPEENGKVVYYLTRALQRYVAPDIATNDPNDATPDIDVLFASLLTGSVYLAVEISSPPRLNEEPLAHTEA